VKPRTAFLFGVLDPATQSRKRCVTPLNPSGHHRLRADRVRKRRDGFDLAWPWAGLFLARKTIRVLEPACPLRCCRSRGFLFSFSLFLAIIISVAQTRPKSDLESNRVASARQQLHNFIFRRRQIRTAYRARLQATPNCVSRNVPVATSPLPSDSSRPSETPPTSDLRPRALLSSER